MGVLPVPIVRGQTTPRVVGAQGREHCFDETAVIPTRLVCLALAVRRRGSKISRPSMEYSRAGLKARWHGSNQSHSLRCICLLAGQPVDISTKRFLLTSIAVNRRFFRSPTQWALAPSVIISRENGPGQGPGRWPALRAEGAFPSLSSGLTRRWNSLASSSPNILK